MLRRASLVVVLGLASASCRRPDPVDGPSTEVPSEPQVEPQVGAAPVAPEPLAIVVQPFMPTDLAASIAQCRAGCAWIYACTVTRLPPGQATLEPGVDEEIAECEVACGTVTLAQLQTVNTIAACFEARCADPNNHRCMWETPG